AAGDPTDRAGARQLSGGAVQGDAAALRDRRARADADGENPRLGDVSLCRADHPGRRYLSHHEPRLRGRNSLGRAGAQPENREMNSSDATPMVRFENVTKRYGSLTVIDGLDLSIGRGEKVAMIGPSGSGKTTVLRMLMTLERIDGGVIWVDGERLTHVERNGRLVPADTNHLRRVRGKIGMVFQH